MERKSRCSLKELFTAFLFLRNKETNIAQDPKGENIVIYLRDQLRFKTSLPVNQRIDELVKLGYIEKHCYNGEALFSVKLLKTRWQEPELTKKLKPKPDKVKLIKIQENQPKPPPSISASVTEKKDEPVAPIIAPTPVASIIVPVVQEKRFLILIDWENLRRHVNSKKLLDFSWLFDPILREGEIEGVFVFIPDHLIHSAPLRTLSHNYRFLCLTALCPPKSENGVAKEKDTVDARLVKFGEFLARHRDITDIVIVCGDWDSQDLRQSAVWRRKKVKIVSSAEAISGNYLFDDKLEKQLII